MSVLDESRRMQNQSEFAGKVVVITGGAGGIGKATALAFAEQGAHVAIADLQARAGEALCDELQAMGVKSLFYKWTSARKVKMKS